MWEDLDLYDLLSEQDGYSQPDYNEYYNGGLDQTELVAGLLGDSNLSSYLPSYDTAAYEPSSELTGFYTDPWASSSDSLWGAAGLSNDAGYTSDDITNMLDFGGYAPPEYQTPDGFQLDQYGPTSDYLVANERTWQDQLGSAASGLGSTIAKVLGVNTPQQQAQRAQQQATTGTGTTSAAQRIAQALGGQMAQQQQTATSGQGARNALMGALAMAASLNPQKALKIDPRGQVAQRDWKTTNQVRRGYANGGQVKGNGGLGEILVQLVKAATQKGMIPGEAGGQDDVVDIKAAPGEYILDAEIVASLGDGNTANGAKKLDKMRHNVRKHKRSGGLSSIPPKAKNVEEYLGAR